MKSGLNGPFTPKTITVVIGVNNTVTWTNNDPNQDIHTITSNTQGEFNSGDLNPGQKFTCTFITVGTYDYHCIYHSLMVGSVIVKSP